MTLGEMQQQWLTASYEYEMKRRIIEQSNRDKELARLAKIKEKLIDRIYDIAVEYISAEDKIMYPVSQYVLVRSIPTIFEMMSMDDAELRGMVLDYWGTIFGGYL